MHFRSHSLIYFDFQVAKCFQQMSKLQSCCFLLAKVSFCYIVTSAYSRISLYCQRLVCFKFQSSAQDSVNSFNLSYSFRWRIFLVNSIIVIGFPILVEFHQQNFYFLTSEDFSQSSITISKSFKCFYCYHQIHSAHLQFWCSSLEPSCPNWLFLKI